MLHLQNIVLDTRFFFIQSTESNCEKIQIGLHLNFDCVDFRTSTKSLVGILVMRKGLELSGPYPLQQFFFLPKL